VSLMCSVMNRVHKTRQWTVARSAQELPPFLLREFFE
jgi:hypothetical protein